MILLIPAGILDTSEKVHNMEKRQKDEFISTRAAGKMLEISTSTATRYFEKGVLKGKKHPITHRRYISRESVLTLMSKYRMKVGT